MVFDGRVFRWQAKCVPAHGLQYILAEHPLVAGNHIPNRIVAHVPHVQLAAWVGEHRQTVVLFPAGNFADFEGGGFLPVLLDDSFYFTGVILVFHRHSVL